MTQTTSGCAAGLRSINYGFLPGRASAESDERSRVTADITANTTWYTTNVYLLNGFIHVLAPATLNIEPGTVIKGVSAGQHHHRRNRQRPVRHRRGKIYAVGTPTHPIIFTAESDDLTIPTTWAFTSAGLWGGVVILGKAVLNTASDTTGNAATAQV